MKKITQYLLLAASVAVMVYGATRGELQVVLMKAVRICMECIGLG